MTPPLQAGAARTVKIDLPLPTDLPPPEGVNFFAFTVSGPEVELLAGYVGLRSLVPDPEVKSIRPEITHRLFMSVRGFLSLKLQMDEIELKLRQQGINIEDLVSAEAL